jgi:hypothetical protein
MAPLDVLTTSIHSQQDQLRATLPPDRRRALLAISKHLDLLPPSKPANTPLDLALCSHRPHLGGQTALRLLLEPGDGTPLMSPAPAADPAWVIRFLAQCRQIEMAMLLRHQVETGYMRLEQATDGSLHAWITRKHLPASLRERADFEWLQASLATSSGSITHKQNAYRLDYPPETVLGATTVATYQAIIDRLCDLASTPLPDEPIRELELATMLANDAGISPETALDAILPLSLTPENAAWHATLPGVALAPLIRVSPDEVILSRRGLAEEPCLFLVRELRRQNAPGYHDAAHHREHAFRADLYDLFTDRRFVHRSSRIVLRRPDGNIRTDIDAAIFDRKTGTLAVFELKSLDPFARSTAELNRQRDSVLYANRQVSGVLDWINRFGANDILNRIDRRTAKTFRVQRVLPFVLCRYLARFDDGPAPDSRAAWASWPAVLRVIEPQAGRSKESNPLATLFQRLRSKASDPVLDGDPQPIEIDLGTRRVCVFPSVGARTFSG